ncbi:MULTISPECIES: (d)CMP kinase [unclassified Wenzhouxiangella]|uniref:(d)CMP kinase n=1 Tax=unclassified Wenzhouxiangella TaxID=2613841 RepID=UPI000E3267DF|nr:MULTISPECIES: (d)CMP kinase [unclassified Wenzhouxiangella]RFF26372.1 (d)CMP kinase [Wenzhouxiangella sp. 15181]RFP67356.1 (d)CMP kinase [Wenzhouxiangella sp. 15190]
MTETADNPVPVLTIDGPSGAGKGAVSAIVAERLGWHLLDSGAVYRAVALAALDRGVDPEDEAALTALCETLDLEFRAGEDGIIVLLDGRAVDERLRSEAVSLMASRVASNPAVRRALLGLQRDFRQLPGLVADGRDMGTVVFSDAPVKVFLDASVEERARRRHKQLKEKGESVKFSRLFHDLAERDRRDRERAVSPTVPASDATVIDSTDLTLEQVVERILDLVANRPGGERKI